MHVYFWKDIKILYSYIDILSFIIIREEGRERNIVWLPPVCAPTWGSNLRGMCPDRELNLQPLGARDDAPTKGATGQGRFLYWYSD